MDKKYNSGRLYAEKLSRNKTELNHCTTNETRWNKKLISRLSPDIAEIL